MVLMKSKSLSNLYFLEKIKIKTPSLLAASSGPIKSHFGGQALIGLKYKKLKNKSEFLSKTFPENSRTDKRSRFLLTFGSVPIKKFPSSFPGRLKSLESLRRHYLSLPEKEITRKKA